MMDTPRDQHSEPLRDLDTRIAAMDQYLAGADASHSQCESLGGVVVHFPGGLAVTATNETLRCAGYALVALLFAALVFRVRKWLVCVH